MDSSSLIVLAAMIGAAAFLYSSVGHAGASGYIAAMALFGLAPEVMKPTALALNILVASIALYRFYQAGCFSWNVLGPFLLGGIPLAFFGGALQIGARFYNVLVGIILLIAAVRLMFPSAALDNSVKPMPLVPAIICGAVLGFLSGLTGTGGGIFLSPLLLLTRWAETKETGGIAAGFILCNSISGLSGRIIAGTSLHPNILVLAIAAVLGGLLGSSLGSKRFKVQSFRFALGVVLVIAGLKLILT